MVYPQTRFRCVTCSCARDALSWSRASSHPRGGFVGLLNKLGGFHHGKLWLLHDVANQIDQNGRFAHGNCGSTIRSIREKNVQRSLTFANR